MTTNRDLKRLVRARMHQTGERYTTALAALQAMKQAAPGSILIPPPGTKVKIELVECGPKETA
jgi:hypothetical protein